MLENTLFFSKLSVLSWYLQYGRITGKKCAFLGLFEKGDDKNKLGAEKNVL